MMNGSKKLRYDMLYFVEFISTPSLTKVEENKLTISGCQFKFHENLNGFASYVVYDESQRELTTIESSLTKLSSEAATYQFDSLNLTSYLRAGSYFRCKLLKSASTLANGSFSDFSELVPLPRKFEL